MTTSPSYELVYFNTPGISQIIRALLDLGGADWKETNPEDWPSLKPTMPLERLPVLIERQEGKEDLVISESSVIERYVARKLGFISSDPAVAVKQEQVRAQFDDVTFLWMEAYIKNNETARPRFDELIKVVVRKHEELLEKNGNNGHYFGNQLTYPDISTYLILSVFRKQECDAEFNEEKAPNLNKLLKVVGDEIGARIK
ncbi:hypothetical protein H4219_005472 [Mycoemilia scoparia]|uniref:GST N-terminal domain-containing protein n=1 Tax=Mycoemilia scoparia TaxID=417184 RepID=A0A9W8DL14_9FUNG|nr:hypothetical protein H4219_005472 [Mycoemilia scoparia]